AQVLATATDSSKPWHLSAEWIGGLTHEEDGSIQPGWVVGASDYLRAGAAFSHDYLDAVGQAAIDYERSRPTGGGDPWQGWGFDRFSSNTPLSDPPVTAVVD